MVIVRDERNVVKAVIVFLILFVGVGMFFCSAIDAKVPGKPERYAALIQNWKIYNNDEGGFQVRYDPRWQMKAIEKTVFFIVPLAQNPYIMIGVFVKSIEDPSQSLREIADGILGKQALFDKPKFEKTTIGNYEALMVSGGSLRHVGTMAAYYFVKRGDDLVTLTITGVPKKQWDMYEESFHAMISSLKFD